MAGSAGRDVCLSRPAVAKRVRDAEHDDFGDNNTLDEQEGATVPLVIMTHTAPTGAFSAAVEEIDKLSRVTAPSLFLPVAD